METRRSVVCAAVRARFRVRVRARVRVMVGVRVRIMFGVRVGRRNDQWSAQP